MTVLTVNATNLIVVGIVAVLIILVIIHLIRVYHKSPCGDCASAKQCRAFNKKNILKAYKKECQLEQNPNR